MMKTSIYACLVASAALFSPTATNAQDGPTYDETLSFLQQKVNVNWGENAYRFSAATRCNFRYEQWHPDGSHDYFSIDAQLLDPTRIEIIDNVVVAYFKDKRQGAQWTSISPKGEILFSKPHDWTSFDLFTFDEAINAPKAKSAFKHLIELCGGKGELF